MSYSGKKMMNSEVGTQPAKVTKSPSSEVALMYSGGLDTTIAAFLLANQYKRVHLLTFCNGICIRVGSSSLHAQELSAKFGRDKFVHKMTYIADLFARIRRDIKQYFKLYKSPLVFDLCCRLAMEVATIIYCLENNIYSAADGNNPAQDAIFLQQLDYLRVVDNFFKSYGIDYIHPTYFSKSRLGRRDYLKQLGFNSGSKLFEKLGITSQLFNQPFCLWAPVAFFFTSRLRKFPLIKKYSLDLDSAIEFRNNRERIAKDYIQRYFENKKQPHCLVVLPATQKGFAAVAALKKEGKKFEIVPVPQKSNCCGVAIRFGYRYKAEIGRVLKTKNIDFKFIQE